MAIDKFWEENGIYVRYSGCIEGKDVLSDVLEGSGDPRFDDLRYIIIDLSEALESTVSMEDIEILNAYNKAMAISNPHIKNAVVSFKGDESREALATLYALNAEALPWAVKVFYALDDARQWVSN